MNILKNKIARNAVWIIACKIVQSVLSLIVTMLTARYLGPSNYGIINYAASLVAFMAPIAQLGLENILVQEIVVAPEKEGETLGTSLLVSAFSSILCILGVVAFAMIANRGETETIIVCGLYSILLIFQSLEMIQYWFQAKYLSKYTSITMLVAYVVVSGYKIILLMVSGNICLFAITQAIDYCIISLVLLCIYKKLGGNKLSFSLRAMKRLLGKSRYYIVSSLMVTVFAQTDRIMIKLMKDNESCGYYSAAVVCAGITSFIFAAIIDSFRPVIFESRKDSEEKFEKNMKLLYSIVIYFSLLQSLAITLLSSLIVNIVYGASYTPAISALRIIVWYSTFSYLGSVRNIWILAENKQKYLWIINLSGAMANIVLNYVLIPVYGINGAALASLITQIFTNVIIGYIINPIRKNNVLMIGGLNIKNLTELIKRR